VSTRDEPCPGHLSHYAVVSINVGEFDLTIFPEGRVGELAAAFKALAEELAVVAKVLPRLNVAALTD